MRFLLDENVSYRVASHLKAAGHDAVHVSEIGLTSTDDLVILARARDEGRVLVSGDHDFVQMLFASGATRPSLVLVREVEAMPSAELAALLPLRCPLAWLNCSPPARSPPSHATGRGSGHSRCALRSRMSLG
jgi:predicted nuclease of predicted toxin-antitoxin system